jgi:hydroxyacylglutathione hydrolase
MKHVVTTPVEPFQSSDGRIEVHQLLSAMDNLVWVVVCNETREAAVVDGPPDADGLLALCEARSLKLTTVLNTHTHWDHIGINKALDAKGLLASLRVFGPALAAKDVPGLTDPVDEGDEARVGSVTAQVLRTEGHMNGHISYVFDDVLFCGDTMFAAGCGYLFDGPASKMHDSLTRLALLPEATRVCCAHEYTEDNLRFAWSVEPDNDALAQRIREAWAIRAAGGCTVPSTIGVERATNPFLRHASPTLRAQVSSQLGQAPTTPSEIFAATRALKDTKAYRERSDDTLPLVEML